MSLALKREEKTSSYEKLLAALAGRPSEPKELLTFEQFPREKHGIDPHVEKVPRNLQKMTLRKKEERLSRGATMVRRPARHRRRDCACQLSGTECLVH